MVRLIREEELAGLLNLLKQLHVNDDPLPADQELCLLWSEIYKNPMIHYFVAETHGKLVSTCMLIIIPNLTRGARPFGLIENVVTDAMYRGKGFGLSVLKCARDFAWRKGCYKVKLLAEPATPEVINFYLKAGFKAGIKTGFVATAKELGAMQKELLTI